MKALVTVLAISVSAAAATNINSGNAYAYCANFGWLNARGNIANGVVIGEYVCSGYLWGANVGWISVGSGAPADGIRYSNTSSADFGVNLTEHYLSGGVTRAKLRGLAHGANIGWINFEAIGNAEISLSTGRLSGYAYSANCGWINLGNVSFCVQADTIAPGADTDGDGIADAWERIKAGNLTTLNGTGDIDGDGVNNFDEYDADTSPLDIGDSLRITAFVPAPDGLSVSLTWTSQLTRHYRLQSTTDLLTSFTLVLDNIVPDGTSTTRVLAVTPGEPKRFYRVQVYHPLAP